MRERINFDDVDSHRVRVGVKGEYEVKNFNKRNKVDEEKSKIKSYVGIGYEQELDGKIKATAERIPLENVSLLGGSAK